MRGRSGRVEDNAHARMPKCSAANRVDPTRRMGRFLELGGCAVQSSKPKIESPIRQSGLLTKRQIPRERTRRFFASSVLTFRFSIVRIGLKALQGARLRRRTTVAATEEVRRVRVSRRRRIALEGLGSGRGSGDAFRGFARVRTRSGWGYGYRLRRGRTRGGGGRGAVDSGGQNGARRGCARGRRCPRR